jgi:GMP synthase-like glutamine amidotransferase
MQIHCFQHVAFENLGTIEDWANDNNHIISYTYFFKKDIVLPDLSNIDLLIVLGGYMNIDDESEFPWLKQEKLFIKQAIISDKKVMGICLGSQLIATALGSNVYKGTETEIGFHPIQFNETALTESLFQHFKSPYTVFQWHGNTFDLPKGAQLLASSEGFKNQGFLWNTNVLALQFHIEMNEIVLKDMLKQDGHELQENSIYIQKEATIRANFHHLEQNKTDLHQLLNQFTKL